MLEHRRHLTKYLTPASSHAMRHAAFAVSSSSCVTSSSAYGWFLAAARPISTASTPSAAPSTVGRPRQRLRLAPARVELHHPMWRAFHASMPTLAHNLVIILEPAQHGAVRDAVEQAAVRSRLAQIGRHDLLGLEHARRRYDVLPEVVSPRAVRCGWHDDERGATGGGGEDGSFGRWGEAHALRPFAPHRRGRSCSSRLHLHHSDGTLE